MDRRAFLKGAAATVAGAFIVPEVIVPERRVWALDRTMVRGETFEEMVWRESLRIRKDIENAMIYGTTNEDEIARVVALSIEGEFGSFLVGPQRGPYYTYYETNPPWRTVTTTGKAHV